jgi:hypothetical protein
MKDFLKANTEILGLGIFSLIALVIVGGRIMDVYGYWYHRIGPVLWLFAPGIATLFSILFLIFSGKIDDRFPSLTELDLLIDGAMMAGLIGTVSGMLSGFAKMGGNGVSQGDFSMTNLMQMIAETFFCTGLGLSLSFAAWFTKKKLFPEEIRRKILAKKLRMFDEQEETGNE